ncbi:MAG TPA: hypothetical protein VN924_32800 [Bryobacteraceae bacterium]|nr:hypothetical protein [Bryobacteraceae bacterium]
MQSPLAALVVFLWPCWTALAQDATTVTYTPLGANALPIHVSDRLYPYGFAVDFCGLTNVDGATDNTVCLQNALNATGVNFQSLEIQPPVYSASGSASVSGSTVTTTGSFANLTPGDTIQIPATTGPYYTISSLSSATQLTVSGTPTGTTWSFHGVSTQVNYVCSGSATALAWNPTASGRVHVWKGANLSCALPPADAMHVVIDDNVQPINPFTATALPIGTTVANFAVLNGPASLTVSGGLSVLMPAPTAPSASCPTSGGSLAAGTYYFQISGLDSAGGVSSPSAEVPCAVASGTSGSAILTWTAQGGATSFRVYYGTSSGGETNYVAAGGAAPSPYTFTSLTGGTAGFPPAYPTALTFTAGSGGTKYAFGTGLDLVTSPAISEFQNSTTGTAANYLALLTSAGVQTAAVSTSSGMAGICVGNCGTAGTAQIAVSGIAWCVFDNATTAGDYAQASTITAGQCHDTLSGSYPANGNQVVGQVLSTNLASGTFQVFLLGPGSVAPAQALGSSSSPTFAGLTLGSPLSLSSGGTGASLTGTTGGVPYFSSSAAMGSSAALTANTLIKGGAPSAPSSGSITDTGTAYTFSPGTVASGTQTIFTLTGPASSGLSNTNSQDVNLNLSRTVTFAGGAGSFTPVGVLIGAPTYAASLAQTFLHWPP